MPTIAVNPQAAKRTTQIWLDEFGRKWGAPVEKGIGEPVCGLSPMGWTAPLETPGLEWLKGLFAPPSGRVVRLGPDEPGEQRKVLIDWDGWIDQQEQNEMMMDQRGTEIAKKMAKDDAIALVDKPTKAFLIERGPSPFPPVDIIQMMRDGDKWALGLEAKRPAWLTDLMLEDMLYSAQKGGLLHPVLRRKVAANQRRKRLGTAMDASVPVVPDAPVSKKKVG